MEVHISCHSKNVLFVKGKAYKGKLGSIICESKVYMGKVRFMHVYE